MKKYIKLVVLTIFIIVFISYFYVDVKNASRLFPNFQFEKIAGNEEVVEDLVVSGDFYYDFYGFQTFRVDSEGTSYFRDEPFLKRLDVFYSPIEIERLQKEYRSFMRGKDQFSGYFYETDEYLAYGATPFNVWGLDHLEFEVAILDKQTKKSDSFRVPIPNRGDYSFVDAKDVFLNENEFYIVTLNEQTDQDGYITVAEVHVYTFDLDRQELIHDEVIGEIDYSNTIDGHHDVHIITDGQAENGNIIVVENAITYVEEVTEDTLYSGEIVQSNKIIQYNYLTKANNEMVIADEDLGMPIALLNDTLYFAQFGPNLLKVIAYDLENSSMINELDVNMAGTILTYSDLYGTVVKDGKLYFVPSSLDFVPSSSEVAESTISVVDLDTLSLEYEGKLSLKKPLDPNRDISFYFTQIELKE